MIVVNFDTVKWVYMSELVGDDFMVTLNFIDGSDMPLFGDDAVKVKSGIDSFVRTTQNWNRVSYVTDDGS